MESLYQLGLLRTDGDSNKQKQENRYIPIRPELCKTFTILVKKTRENIKHKEALYIPNRPKQYKTTAIRINKPKQTCHTKGDQYKPRQTCHTKGDQYKSNPDGQCKTENNNIQSRTSTDQFLYDRDKQNKRNN